MRIFIIESLDSLRHVLLLFSLLSSHCFVFFSFKYVEEPVESYAAQTRDKLAQLYHKMIGQPVPVPEEPHGMLASAKAKITDFFGRATAEYEPESTAAAAVRKASELAGKATAAVETVAEKGTQKASKLIDSTMQQIESIFRPSKTCC